MSMILYNVRHRGCYEYEKFALNTFQLHNELQRLTKKVRETSQESFSDTLNDLDAVIDELCKVDGTGQKLLLLKLEMEALAWFKK